MTTYRKYLPDGDYVVLPDLQIPSHDGKALKAVCDFIADVLPKGVLNVGDESDSPEPARWNKGQAEEYIGTFWENALLTNRIMQQIDDALRMRRGDDVGDVGAGLSDEIADGCKPSPDPEALRAAIDFRFVFVHKTDDLRPGVFPGEAHVVIAVQSAADYAYFHIRTPLAFLGFCNARIAWRLSGAVQAIF